MKEMAAAKSPTDLFQLQSEMFRKSFDSCGGLWLEEHRGDAEARQRIAFAPLSSRVSLAVEKVRVQPRSDSRSQIKKSATGPGGLSSHAGLSHFLVMPDAFVVASLLAENRFPLFRRDARRPGLVKLTPACGILVP
jgi:hypothetical protein